MTDAPQDFTPEQAQMAARVRRMMLIAGLTTGIGIAAVFVAIGYRLFRSEGSAPAADLTATLPKGARITATQVAGDRLLVTLDVAGTTEIRAYDARTLRPAGRLRFAVEP
jgi:Tfp pilus assembly protein PilN